MTAGMDAAVLKAADAPALDDPYGAVQRSLDDPIGSAPIERIVSSKGKAPGDLRACIVVSDNTRPVPYRGPGGILWPVIERLTAAGVLPSRILVLVATGTHRGLATEELRALIDPRVFDVGVEIANHDCRDAANLRYLGKTSRGSEILVNAGYVKSDIRILTGLVESHFMAGASGGRKSICPGIAGERTIHGFHGPAILADERSADLVLEGNPCHEEALEAARAAGADFIVNATLDRRFRLTGVFSGHLELAHARAVEFLRKSAVIPVKERYDVVLTHGGFVGINHYQTAKAAVTAARVVKPGGYVILAADNTETERVGSAGYRKALRVLKERGSAGFDRLIVSPEWEFVQDQWQVQMWNRLFRVIPQEHFFYYSPQFTREDYDACPGRPLAEIADCAGKTPRQALAAGLAALRSFRQEPRADSAAFLPDGPNGVPWG